MKISIEVPDGIACNGCDYLINGLEMSNQRDEIATKCKLFNCHLGHAKKDVYKCPMCIKQEQAQGMFTYPPGVKGGLGKIVEC